MYVQFLHYLLTCHFHPVPKYIKIVECFCVAECRTNNYLQGKCSCKAVMIYHRLQKRWLDVAFGSESEVNARNMFLKCMFFLMTTRGQLT